LPKIEGKMLTQFWSLTALQLRRQSFMQYNLIEEIKLENKWALSNNVTAPRRLANTIASSSFHTDIARIHPQFLSSGPFTISGK